MRHEPTDEVGGARSVDAGRRHDARLAQAVGFGDSLKDGELPRRQGSAHMPGKQAVRPLAGAMQKMQCGLQRRRKRRRTRLWHGTFAGGGSRP